MAYPASSLASEQITAILQAAAGKPHEQAVNLLADEILRLRDVVTDAYDDLRAQRERMDGLHGYYHPPQLPDAPPASTAAGRLHAILAGYEPYVGAMVAIPDADARELLAASAELAALRHALETAQPVLTAVWSAVVDKIVPMWNAVAPILESTPDRERLVHDDPALAQQIRDGIDEAERGEAVYLGSFAQYLDGDDD
jgi:hypothetical protein